MLKIGIITGSIRDVRVNLAVAEYFKAVADSKNLENVSFEIVDIKDYQLPIFNEALPPAMANKQYNNADVQKWSDKIDGLDGYIFITPEYNKSITSALKNNLDYIGPEFAHKSAGIVGYGSTLGIAAINSLRGILANFKLADVTPHGAFNLFTDFVDMKEFTPSEVHTPTINAVIDDVVAWGWGMKAARENHLN